MREDRDGKKGKSRGQGSRYCFLLYALSVAAGALEGCCVDSMALDPSKINPEHTRNYHAVVEGRIYRSGRITPEGFEYLYGHGLKSVINLRPYHSDEEWVPEDRRDYYHHMRLRPGWPPSEEQMIEILEIVRDPNNWPVLIHCAAGETRTGIVVAVIRYSIEGWPMGKALEEAKKYHSDSLVNKRNLEFVHQWQRKHKPAEWKWH